MIAGYNFLLECKTFSVRRLQKEFSNKQGKKLTLNDFLQKFVTIGSAERTAVSGRLVFLYFLVLSGRVAT